MTAEASQQATPTVGSVLSEMERMARLGRYVTEFAIKGGWDPTDGEGAFEYIQRHSYAVGLSDAGGTPPGTETWGNRWPIADLEAAPPVVPGWVLVQRDGGPAIREIIRDIGSSSGEGGWTDEALQQCWSEMLAASQSPTKTALAPVLEYARSKLSNGFGSSSPVVAQFDRLCGREDVRMAEAVKLAPKGSQVA